MAKAKKTSTKKKSTTSKKADVWPLARNVFFRPDRHSYVRKMIKPIGCVFCKSASQKLSLDTLCVFKSEHSQIVLNKYPYNTGHVLVLPLRHNGDILNLSDIEYDDLHKTLKIAIAAVKKVYDPNAFNIGLNHGVTSGAGIPDHLHYHLVPRWNGDLNFFPLIAETKVVIETNEQAYKKMTEYFSQLKDLR